MARVEKKKVCKLRSENNPIETSIENVRRKYDLDLAQTMDLIYRYIHKKTENDEETKLLILDDLKFVLFD